MVVMMPGYGGGMGGWGWMFMSLSTLVFLALIAGVVWLIVRATATGSTSSRSPATGSAPAREILAERYARGEIDEQEYQQRLRTLGG
jgi:putative membrane protein